MAEDHDWEEYRQIIRSIGTPQQLRRKIEAIDDLLEERRHRAWLRRSMRTIVVWAASIFAAWLAVKGFVLEIVPWIRAP